MKTIISCILIFNFFQTLPVAYKEIKLNDGSFNLSIPRELEGLKPFGWTESSAQYSKTYISSDTTVFLYVDVFEDKRSRIRRSWDIWKSILQQGNTSTILLSERMYFQGGMWVASVDYKTAQSGTNINRFSVYTSGKYVVSIDIWVKNTYRGQCGNSDEMISRINNSLKVN